MKKITVVVLFGGQSSEHDVSLMSAANMISAFDHEKYEIIPVGITKNGNWKICHGSVDTIKNNTWETYSTDAILSPDASKKCLLKLVGGKYKEISIDVVVPALHGAWGEDGTIQGLLELAQIPYVGCGVLASAVSMDKVYTKLIAKSAKIPMANYIWCDGRTLEAEKEKIIHRVEKKLGYPCFVKPSNAGSSVGISKAKNKQELEQALFFAAKHDRKVIIEEAISGRELECSVLGNQDIRVSGVGEILAEAEFYEKQLSMQLDLYRNFSAYTDGLQQVRRRLTRELSQVCTALDRGDYNRVFDRSQHLQGDLENLKVSGYCQNSLLNAVLFMKKREMDALGISFAPVVQLEESTFVKRSDLCRIVSNLLDNAVEACAAVPAQGRLIRFTCMPVKHTLLIKTANPFTGNRLPGKTGLPRSTKKETGHGYGLSSVKEIVEAYQGVLNVELDEMQGLACVTVTLFER